MKVGKISQLTTNNTFIQSAECVFLNYIEKFIDGEIHDYKTSCGHKIQDDYEIDFKYCPYCGKQIKIELPEPKE